MDLTPKHPEALTRLREHHTHTTIHSDNWSTALLADVRLAAHSILLVSHSILVPLPNQQGPWADLWAFLSTPHPDGPTIEVFACAPTRSHPATLNNTFSTMRLHKAGATCHLIPPPRILHAKCIVIDQNLSWVGSGNMTAAAHAHNREVWMRHAGIGLAAVLRHTFNTWL